MGESGALEFKSDEALPEKMAKEIVAFANLRGGRILLGVSDDGMLTGWECEKTEEWLMDTVVAEYVHPRLIPDYEELNIDGKRVGVVTVPRGVAKPYTVRNKQRTDFYIRIGSVSRKASREQIMRMMESTSPGIVEKLPVHGGGDFRKELNMSLVENYLFGVVEYDSSDDVETLLKNRDLLVRPEYGDKLLCSYVAYVLFAQNPLRRLPQAGLRILVFKGEDKDYDAALDKELDAPFLGYLPYLATLPSIPDLMMAYLRPHISGEKIGEHMRRERKWDYPEEALRELVVNAFAHRDWTRATKIRIVVYSDRLEVESPGALPNDMTVEKIKSGQQMPRNQNIVRILRDYKFVEDRGMGIRQKVIPLMLKHNGCEPEFEATEDYFRVVLRKGKRGG